MDDATYLISLNVRLDVIARRQKALQEERKRLADEAGYLTAVLGLYAGNGRDAPAAPSVPYKGGAEPLQDAIAAAVMAVLLAAGKPLSASTLCTEVAAHMGKEVSYSVVYGRLTRGQGRGVYQNTAQGWTLRR